MNARGEGPETVVYGDLCCPSLAAAWPRIAAVRGRLVFGHFPVVSKHPRAPAVHAAAEAAGAQGAFFEMLASLLGDQGRLDDPHLWRRAETLGLDLKRFEADRRAPSTRERVRRDVEAGLDAGVAGTFAVFRDGREVGVDDL